MVTFGTFRTAGMKVTGRRNKKWHGPVWKKFGSIIFGTVAKPSLHKAKHLMYVRPCQINDLIALFGRPEERFVDQMIECLKPGDVVVDAGAYIGQYTMLASERVGPTGRVVAIEPDDENYKLLEKNIHSDASSNVHLLKAALGGKEGQAQFTSVGEDSALCTLKEDWISDLYPKTDLARRVKTVEVKTLPHLMHQLGIDCVDLLKVDVEGAETQVFEGAGDCLRSGKVRRIICELHGTRHEVKKQLEEFGFDVDVRKQHIIAYHKKTCKDRL